MLTTALRAIFMGAPCKVGGASGHETSRKPSRDLLSAHEGSLTRLLRAGYPPDPMKPPRGVWLVAVCALSCGAGDKLSGTADPSPALCPTFRELAPKFTQLLSEDRFSRLPHLLEQDLAKPLDPRSPNAATPLSAVLGLSLRDAR